MQRRRNSAGISFQKKVIEIITAAKELMDQIEGDYLAMIGAGLYSVALP
jgi:hypothetical protein